jgi:hypothetical protein
MPVFPHSVVNRRAYKMRTKKLKNRSSDKRNYTLNTDVISTKTWGIYCSWHHICWRCHSVTDIFEMIIHFSLNIIRMTCHWKPRITVKYYQICQDAVHENLWCWKNVWTFEIDAPFFSQYNKRATLQFLILICCSQMFADGRGAADARLSYHPPPPGCCCVMTRNSNYKHVDYWKQMYK